MTRAPALHPKDAATLIILRRDVDAVRILMGKRHAAHKFMPNKFVFPGGRVDMADCRVKPARDLHPAVKKKLVKRMRGRPSDARARGLGMAAVRETFEETGLIIGIPSDEPPTTRSQDWRTFFDHGHVPDLSGLRYLARAITPPGRPKRFDTRFFVIEAGHVRNLDDPVRIPSDELLDPFWFTFEEAHELELPWITGEILRRLAARLEADKGLEPGADITFQFMRGKSWRYERL